MGAVILDHRRLPREHVEKLVFLFVPVSFGRTGPWLERLDIGAEMGQSPYFGIAKQFEGTVTLCPVLSALIVLWLIFSDDHLFSVGACHSNCGLCRGPVAGTFQKIDEPI